MDIKRNPVIDYMRCLGMALIIFAHISPPLVLFQLRTFDVPMMAFISGMAFYCAEKQKVKFTSYALSRVKRLVYPVWAFQLLFFLALFIVKPAPLYPLVSLQTIISSAALSGFGFFWIIKIFILLSVLSPLYFRASEYLSGVSLTIVVLISLLTASILPALQPHGDNISTDMINYLITEMIIPSLTYGAMFISGVKWLTMQRSERMFCFITFTATTLGFIVYREVVHGTFPYPQDDKYPPGFYFISYAIPMTCLVYHFLYRFTDKEQSAPEIIRFISSNTLWIYLWHIPVVTYFSMSQSNMHFILKYLIALSCGLLLTRIQHQIIQKILYTFRHHRGVSAFIRQTFTG
ncbi:acyltransferase family protein [Tatumella terrea]|uniref:Acyltransferase n=1 Tax=Tatumella terrea TaxID=419007 RepID=A0ABW1VUH0_9GAMM